MKVSINRIVLLMLTVIPLQFVHSQTMIKKTFKKGEVVLLKEIGAMVVGEDSGLVIRSLIPGRNQAQKPGGIQDGDRITMAEGIRIDSIPQLEELYINLTAGDTLKLGLYRGTHMHLASLIKDDSSAMPAGAKIMIQSQKHNPTKSSIRMDTLK